MEPNIHMMVLDTLNRATSQDTEVLKPAERKLQEWEIEPGYYSVLLDILSNHEINVNVRWLAVMCFKNGAERYWRRSAPNAISEEEKHKLRQGLITSSILTEPVTQIATQQAVLIAKIARFDCPVNWPNLVPALIGAFKAPQPLVQQRSLLIFRHVVKAMASKRLTDDRRTFQELTTTVYSYILNLWHENTELFLRNIQEGAATEVITDHLEKALMCLRIMRKLTVYGFKKLEKSQEATAFLNAIFDRAKSSLECRKLLKGRGIDTLELCEKFIIHLTKVALDVLGLHPFAFVPLIPKAMEFTLFYCFTEQGMTFIYERFTIQCLNILKGILRCAEYKMIKNLPSLQSFQAAMEMLNQNVCHMCRHLVTHYFLLNGDDLGLWDLEPECFATDEAGESWKYSLRPCVEAVFMELFHEHRKELVPELVRLLATQQQQQANPSDLNAILKKDAIYNAVGLAAFDLYDEVNFDEWFTNVLSQELKITDDNYRIIRRRICQLIGQWCSVLQSKSLKPALYAALLEPLSRPSEDAAVKLAAAKALRSTIDDFNFDVEKFAPYASHAVSALNQLLIDCEECDTKMHVLHVLSFVMERIGASVARGGHAAALFAYLPELWSHAATHNMLKAAVLSAIVNLVKALGECSPSALPWVVSVIEESTRVSSPEHVYLLEDALELWTVVLEAAPAHTPALLHLADNLQPILEQSTENMRQVIHIMRVYTLLGPEEFLLGPGAKCMAVLEYMLSDMVTEGILIILKMAELCISVTYPATNTYLGAKVIWPILIRVLRGLLEGDDPPQVMSLQLVIVARIILLSSDLFYKAVQEAAADQTKYDCDPVKALSRVLHVWTDHMNMISQLDKWKVVGLGLAALLTTQNSTVLQMFPAIMINLNELLNDVMDIDEKGAYFDGLISQQGSRSPSQLLCLLPVPGDPAHTLDLRHAIHHQLETLKGQIGLDTYNQLIQSTDRDTLQQLREYIPL